ncbi:MAG: hypothetical protein ICV84_01070 [Flavisolibacter sp.]|nr:hypothetical protein [Flavisolibacter sp.]
MFLVDSKTAVSSGTITKISSTQFPWFVIGDPIWFKIRDNGEGITDLPDEFTDYYFGTSGCTDYGFSLLQPIENGDIQIK